ncbi:MAG: hypothetical protein HOH43_15360 [Candidatus Latescibacteria bacterium]|nr:hypothetical protein [Candidatus Latescibacterota bacterium]
MKFAIKDLPLNTRLAAKKSVGPKPETVREKSRIVIKEYDSDNFIVGLKRGNKFVKKFLAEKASGKGTVSITEAEAQIRKAILAGDFDKDLIENYKMDKPTGKRRGRPPKK